MQSHTLIRELTEQPLVRGLSVEAAQAVLALRYSILCRRSGHDPMPELERRWGNILAARRFRLVVEAIAHVWPDPFAVAPPCCPRLSFDEALLAAVVGAVSRGDRVDFDWRTAEMLSSDAREMLFAALEISSARGHPGGFDRFGASNERPSSCHPEKQRGRNRPLCHPYCGNLTRLENRAFRAAP